MTGCVRRHSAVGVDVVVVSSGLTLTALMTGKGPGGGLYRTGPTPPVPCPLHPVSGKLPAIALPKHNVG